MYKSTKHKNKTISEYIVYLMMGDTPIEANTAIGVEDKDLLVLSYVTRYNWAEIINTDKN